MNISQREGDLNYLNFFDNESLLNHTSPTTDFNYIESFLNVEQNINADEDYSFFFEEADDPNDFYTLIFSEKNTTTEEVEKVVFPNNSSESDGIQSKNETKLYGNTTFQTLKKIDRVFGEEEPKNSINLFLKFFEAVQKTLYDFFEKTYISIKVVKILASGLGVVLALLIIEHICIFICKLLSGVNKILANFEF